MAVADRHRSRTVRAEPTKARGCAGTRDRGHGVHAESTGARSRLPTQRAGSAHWPQTWPERAAHPHAHMQEKVIRVIGSLWLPVIRLEVTGGREGRSLQRSPGSEPG